ncbi:restriction endonuclease subunit S [Treponema sp. Marseille-Q4130]|uniref:restriction endonuclease subunit S n=1 Tax=Treponema sp. Marseille-Q4130 TaxID=2766702 RepID=UPI001651E4B9|nr:restriction endonuclease subunit S [Treponema sp. Marseille-Q4130]
MKDIEGEIPFDLPDGWAIVHLKDIGIFRGGQTPQTSELCNSGDIPYFKVSDMNTCGNEFFMTCAINYLTTNIKYRLFPKNSIIFPKNGGAVFTNKKRILIKESLIDLNSGAFIPSQEVDSIFIYYLFSTIDFNKFYKGSAVPTIDFNLINELLWGLPPLAEQKRIVAKIETIFAQIDLLEQNKADLQKAVKQVKSKILDLAIHGKLVRQDPADEPASVLLEKLRVEKEAKIAAGEIKRGKNDSYIYKSGTDNCYYEKFADKTTEQIEVPFDLPESWCWQKISSICEINPKNKLDDPLDVSFVPMTLIDAEFNNSFTYEVRKWEVVKSGFSHFSDDDIGIAKITPCFENRKSVIFRNLKNKYGAGSTELHILRTNNQYIFNEYVFWFIKTDSFIKAGINNFTGAVGQQRIGKKILAETLIPIPPLNEQIKICRSINKLMKELDEIILNIV